MGLISFMAVEVGTFENSENSGVGFLLSMC